MIYAESPGSIGQSVKQWFMAVKEDDDSEFSATDGSVSSSSGLAKANASLLWAGIVRNHTMLVETLSHSGRVEGDISGTVDGLLGRPPVPGWDKYSQTSWLTAGRRGIKLHSYEECDGELLIWTFACVYESGKVNTLRAQAFLQQMAKITLPVRSTDQLWRCGDYQDCQDVFEPILEHEMHKYGVSNAALHESFDFSMTLMASNRELLRHQSTREELTEKQTNEQKVLQQKKDLNRQQSKMEALAAASVNKTSCDSPRRIGSYDFFSTNTKSPNSVANALVHHRRSRRTGRRSSRNTHSFSSDSSDVSYSSDDDPVDCIFNYIDEELIGEKFIKDEPSVCSKTSVLTPSDTGRSAATPYIVESQRKNANGDVFADDSSHQSELLQTADIECAARSLKTLSDREGVLGEIQVQIDCPCDEEEASILTDGTDTPHPPPKQCFFFCSFFAPKKASFSES